MCTVNQTEVKCKYNPMKKIVAHDFRVFIFRSIGSIIREIQGLFGKSSLFELEAADPTKRFTDLL